MTLLEWIYLTSKTKIVTVGIELSDLGKANPVFSPIKCRYTFGAVWLYWMAKRPKIRGFWHEIVL